MKGIEKGRKKRNRITLRVRFKEKQSVNGIAYPYLRWNLDPSTTCLTQSQVEVAFVIFTFHILLFISTCIRKPWVLSGCRKKGAMEGILLLLHYREGGVLHL